jgi:hypothetical protein
MVGVSDRITKVRGERLLLPGLAEVVVARPAGVEPGRASCAAAPGSFEPAGPRCLPVPGPPPVSRNIRADLRAIC